MSEPRVVGPLPFATVPPDWKALCVEHNAGANGQWWFAVYVGDELAATGAWSRCHNRGWLGPSAVALAFRGRGFQRLLIDERVRHAAAEGVSVLEAATNKWNTYSQANLEKCGFRLVKETDAKYYGKELTNAQ